MRDLDELFQAYQTDRVAHEAELFAAIHRTALSAFTASVPVCAEDAAQDAVISVLQALPSFRAECLFTHWLRAVLRRQRADVIRQLAAERARWAELEQEHKTAESMRLAIIPEHVHGVDRVLYEKLAEGYGLSEIASQLCISPTAVWQRALRLRKKIINKSKRE